jgi:hypothetical protein
LLAINEKSDKVLSALTTKLSIQVPEYKISSDHLLQLVTPLSQDDMKPSTPIADFVPVSDSKNLTVEHELYEKNKVDSYIPGWFGKGMKK